MSYLPSQESLRNITPLVGETLKDMPLDTLITSMATGIADAQMALDQKSIQITQMMSGTYDNKDYKIDFGGKKYSLLELGFTPSFYQFVETTLEVKMTVEVKITTNTSGKKSMYAWCQTVTAENSNKFQFSASGSSIMKTKLVPLPPPAILEERVRAMLQEQV